MNIIGTHERVLEIIEVMEFQKTITHHDHYTISHGDLEWLIQYVQELEKAVVK